MNDAAEEKSIRLWWSKKTGRIRRIIVWSSLIACIGAAVFYRYAPHEMTLRLQIFNGAYLIPVTAAIWIAVFVFLFLMPSREVGFRSQETLERTEAGVQKSLDKVDRFLEQEAAPTLQAIRKVIETFETQYVKDIQSTIYVCQDSAKHAVETADRTEKRVREIHQDLTPVIASASRILGQTEKYIRGGLLDQIHAVATRMEAFGAPKNGSTEPDLERSLSNLRKKPHLNGSASRPAAALIPPSPMAAPKPAPTKIPTVLAVPSLPVADPKKSLPAGTFRITSAPVEKHSPVPERSLS